MFRRRQLRALLLVDLEEEYSKDEIAKLERDVREKGLGLFVAADWYSVSEMKSLKFLDDNTHFEWEAATGGANVPALNDLLRNFGVQFGGDVFEGSVDVGADSVVVSSGTHVSRAPAGAYLHSSKELKARDGSNRDGGSSAFLASFERIEVASSRTSIQTVSTVRTPRACVSVSRARASSSPSAARATPRTAMTRRDSTTIGRTGDRSRSVATTSTFLNSAPCSAVDPEMKGR